jgi:hypothetical protein
MPVRNFSADATFDEFFLWIDYDDNLSDAQNMWNYGRYFKPFTFGSDSYKEEPTFISGYIDVTYFRNNRNFPQGKTTGVDINVVPPNSLFDEDPLVTDAKSRPIRILGVEYTWFAEDTDPNTGKPILYTYYDIPPRKLSDISVDFDMIISLKDGSIEYEAQPSSGEYVPILDATLEHPIIATPSQLQYKVNFRFDYGANDMKGLIRWSNVRLLATPVFDDITIYIDTGVKIFSYTLVY